MQAADAENLLAKLEKNRYVRDEKELIESVLQVALAANREAFEKMRKEVLGMYDALRDFMAADFQQAEEKGVGIGELRRARETTSELAEMGLPVEKIAKAVKVSVKQVEEWLSEPIVMA